MSTSPWLLSCVGVPPLPSCSRSNFLARSSERDRERIGDGDRLRKRAARCSLRPTSGPSRNRERRGDVLRDRDRLWIKNYRHRHVYQIKLHEIKLKY